LHWTEARPLYQYQLDAVNAWQNTSRRGTIILPTGTGKGLVGLSAISGTNISTLIVSPTLDLMNQWYGGIMDAFGVDVGILGGGFHEIRPITVTTYDSAYRHIDRYGNKFGLLIFDEIHHLPAPAYAQIPELSLAPYRLGLTATYRRTDAKHLQLTHLIEPVVYEKRIADLKGTHLSQYEIHRIYVPLAPEERSLYETHESIYRQYVRENKIRYFGNQWEHFLRKSAGDPKAREALLARMEMRRIVFGAKRKLETLESILKQHPKDRIIVFTQHNALVYEISRYFFIPAVTHQTDAVERKAVLDRFRKGAYRMLVTSKVLNEGVDVPDANVAIILGGSASPVEHLQRLGRILRKKSGKTAMLYEIVTEGTQEINVSYRRRESDAYR
jgi:superfamily II DNA or RNA helicase